MPNPLQQAGAMSEPTSFAPLHSDRIFTGFWSNRSPLRDAATSSYMVRYGMSRQDSMIDGSNTEISARLTLIRRAGFSVYNSQTFAPIQRFYAFNVFTTTTEDVRVMVDTAGTVYDATGPNTKNPIWTKGTTQPTYFLGVGNDLYMANGVENIVWHYPGAVSPWGQAGPTTAPLVSQSAYPNPFTGWAAGYVFMVVPVGASSSFPVLVVVDPHNNLQFFQGAPSLLMEPRVGGVTPPPPSATTGTQEPAWLTQVGALTPDGTFKWRNMGSADYQFNHLYSKGDMVAATVQTSTGALKMMFENIGATANSGTGTPTWSAAPGTQTWDVNGIIWVNFGAALTWAANLGPNTNIVSVTDIMDSNGYHERVISPGKSGTEVTWLQTPGAITRDNDILWQNLGGVAVGETAPVQYGYAWFNPTTKALTNMSPASLPITRVIGNQVVVQGVGAPDPAYTNGFTQVVVYRTMQGGSVYYQLTTLNVTAASQSWTYNDVSLDSDLNLELTAANAGQLSPLPVGATCLEYHCNRIWAAVGNVIYRSAGLEGAVYGANGNSGFNPTETFTVQSKVTRLWASVQGLFVYTVRDCYLITGGGTDPISDPFIIQVYIAALPLLNYDAFCVHLTTPYLYTGYRMVLGNDPSAGIVDVSFPIEDILTKNSTETTEEYDPATSYLTFHHQETGETAMYLYNGKGQWFRMSATSAPEQGSNWSPPCTFQGSASAMQSVEVKPGVFALLLGAGGGGGPILKRDVRTRSDNGVPYPAFGTFGSVTMAEPGQLAALAFMTLESTAVGSAPSLSVLLGETAGNFEKVPRSRQDPPDLPPSKTVRADRHSLLQGQSPVWCRHFQFRVDWPTENALNELLTFTIFGQTWQEMRSQ